MSRLRHALGSVGRHVSPSRGVPSWIGGQGTDPYEQNTQQSPALGRSITPQPEHS